jgi:hypothetical protein
MTIEDKARLGIGILLVFAAAFGGLAIAEWIEGKTSLARPGLGHGAGPRLWDG